MRDIILKILREGTCATNVIQQKLEYDHNEKYKIAQVRARLHQMENEGIIKTIACEYKSKLKWSIV
jgi:DNA-binding PadR family transcriptional regulator